MEVKQRDLGCNKLLEVNGNVDLYKVSEWKNSLFELIDDPEVYSAIIDMQNIHYMHSSGVGALVAAQKKIKSKEGKFGSLRIQDDALNILRLAILDRFFNIYTSKEEIQG